MIKITQICNNQKDVNNKIDIEKAFRLLSKITEKKVANEIWFGGTLFMDKIIKQIPTYDRPIFPEKGFLSSLYGLAIFERKCVPKDEFWFCLNGKILKRFKIKK